MWRNDVLQLCSSPSSWSYMFISWKLKTTTTKIKTTTTKRCDHRAPRKRRSLLLCSSLLVIGRGETLLPLTGWMLQLDKSSGLLSSQCRVCFYLFGFPKNVLYLSSNILLWSTSNNYKLPHRLTLLPFYIFIIKKGGKQTKNKTHNQESGK